MIFAALQHKSKFNFDIFWKENQFFGFSCCSTREDLSIDISFNTVGLILTKLRRFLFSGYGQTDRRMDGQTDGHADRQTRFWNSHMETCRHTKIFNSKLKISSYLSIVICIPGWRGCIIRQFSKLYIYIYFMHKYINKNLVMNLHH